MADWPGREYVQPVIINAGRPPHSRGRHASDVYATGGAAWYQNADGQYLVPAGGPGFGGPGFGGPINRPHSASGHRPPAQVVINNANWDEHSPTRRPHSSHGRDYYDDDRDYDRGSRSRSRSRYHERSESEIRKQIRAEILAQEEEEERTRKKIESEIILKKAKEEAEAARRKKEEEEAKKKAVEDWNHEQRKEKDKKEKEKERVEKEVRERVISSLRASGMTDAEIEIRLRQEDRRASGGTQLITGTQLVPSTTVARTRPLHIKVHKKYLEIATLEAYGLDWEIDENDYNYILIKQWLAPTEQDALFEHTRKLREGRLLTNPTIELRRQRDQLQLVRRRNSPARKSWVIM